LVFVGGVLLDDGDLIAFGLKVFFGKIRKRFPSMVFVLTDHDDDVWQGRGERGEIGNEAEEEGGAEEEGTDHGGRAWG
jgi:hypothetical protein